MRNVLQICAAQCVSDPALLDADGTMRIQDQSVIEKAIRCLRDFGGAS